MDERVVVFDLGMVLVSPVGLFEELGELLGRPAAEVKEQYWVHRHTYDQGIPDEDYWEQTFPLLGLPVEEVPGLLTRLVEIDTRGWSHLREGARQILLELRDRGRRIAVLSNMPTSLSAGVRSLEWATLFDNFFFSGPMGIAKPDRAIYAAVHERLGKPGNAVWFVDDKIENVEGAQSCGWNAHLWRDDADTRAWLVAEGLL